MADLPLFRPLTGISEGLPLTRHPGVLSRLMMGVSQLLVCVLTLILTKELQPVQTLTRGL
jgi:hypothetical protein